MTPLPGAPHLAYRHDRLTLDGLDLQTLGQQYGTPLYVYSASAMRAAARAYQEALAGHPHLLCYAMKANSNLAVLQLFARLGLGFDIVSGGELQRVLAAGGQASKVVFSGVGKTRAEMAMALHAGVRCFNVESQAELEVLSEVAESEGRPARVSLRVNPDVDARTHPYISTGLKGNKFGVAHDRALALYGQARRLKGLEVVGIDCHIGSQITEIDPYLDALDRVLDLVEAIEREGTKLHHLDLGGGLGITYTDEQPPSPQALVGAMMQRIASRGHAHREVFLEPGRSLVGNAGVLLTDVLYLKPAQPDEVAQGGRHFCIVDAAMNDLMRPALYEAWMGIVECVRSVDHASSRQNWDVVGPVCESGDWLGRDRSLAVQAGDTLAVLSAGAYGMTMASNYNTRGRAAEVMIDGGHAHLIRERETPQQLFAGEHLLA